MDLNTIKYRLILIKMPRQTTQDVPAFFYFVYAI